MTFIVNGADWRFDELAIEEVVKKIDDFLQFVAISVEREETVWIGNDFQSRTMLGDLSLWNTLYELPLPREMCDEMIAWLGRPKYYRDSDDRPNEADIEEVSVDAGEKCQNADVAWVHHCVREGIVAACVTLNEGRPRETHTTLGSETVHFVKKDQDRKVFWRKSISLEGGSLAYLTQYAPHAFPDIYFVDGVLRDLDKLGGGYLASRVLVQEDLAKLNDWGNWVFLAPPPALTPPPDMTPGEYQQENGNSRPPNQLITKRFLNFGLDVAPEKSNVKRDKNCYSAREADIGGQRLYCEWHIKLEPNRNRIHIHPPVPESGKKVVVGMIAEHLPLPGNSS